MAFLWTNQIIHATQPAYPTRNRVTLLPKEHPFSSRLSRFER